MNRKDLNSNRIYLTKDEDFIFCKNEWGGDYIVKGRGKGYFQYIGKEKAVETPHIIQGHPITSYYKMFGGCR